MRGTLGLFVSLPAVALIALALSTSRPSIATAAAVSASLSIQAAPPVGGVYTMNNDQRANAILALRRHADGSLTRIGLILTGGRGSGGTVDPLVSQSSLLLDDENRFLFAVNARSDDVSVFRVLGDGSLQLTDLAPSGGRRPVSLANHGRLLYVLNTGDNTVSGLRLDTAGKLTRIPRSTRALAPGAAGASTIQFSGDGAWLIVTELESNRIETFAVAPDGSLGAPVVTPSSGAMPFGFDVTSRSQPIITEALGAPPNGAVSSYRIRPNGTLDVVTASRDAGGAAACWLVLTADDRFAFVTNTASNAVASFRLDRDGRVMLLDGRAGDTGAGSSPLDLDLTADERFLYVLEGGSGSIGTFELTGGGTLAMLPDTPAARGASGLQGLAAW